MEWIKFYLIGIIILLVAILANFMAAQIGLKTWYAFLEGITNGQGLSLKDGLWLFVFYPLVLGVSAHFGHMLWNGFF